MRNNWQTKKLGEICNIQIGKTPRREINKYWNGSRPWVKISELNDQKIYDTKEKITDIAIQEQNCKLVPKGSVLYSFKLSIGKLGVAGVDLYTNEAIAAIIPRDNKILNSEYLFYYLPLVKYEKFLSGAAKGKTLNSKTLPLLSIILPSLDIQQQIVEKLDAIRKLQELNKKEIKKAEELFTSFVSKKLDPKNNNWSEKTLNELIDDKKGGVKIGPFGSALKINELVDNGPVRVLYIENVVNNEFDWHKKKFITQEKYNELSSYEVFPSDILITIMGTIGRTCIVPGQLGRAIISSHLIKISVDEQKIIPEFLNYALNSSHYVINQMTIQAKGAIMKGLNSRIIKNLKIPLPSIAIQRQIVEKINEIQNYKKNLFLEKDKLSELFGSTLNKLMKPN